MLLTDTYINQSIIVVESERIYMPFIYWNICGRYEELRVISNSNSIRGSLTTKMISAFTSPKADITQISRFSELAWAAIHEIEKNCNEIARLAAIRDTLIIRDTVPLLRQKVEMVTPYIQLTGLIENKRLKGDIKVPVTLNQAVWVEYKGWWFWKRVKAIHQSISSDNPYVEIRYSEYIRIQ